MKTLNLSEFSKKEKLSKEANASKNSISDLLNKEISFTSGKPGDKQKERFYSDLAVLLSAGVDIKSALDIICSEQEKPKQKELYKNINRDLISGSSLSRAIKKTDKFSQYEYYSLEIGEETGKLIEILKDLSAYYQNRIIQRRNIISALTYPAIVLLVTFGSVFFMLNFIVPMFTDIFKRFKGELPAITKTVIGLSAFMNEYAGIFFLTIILLIVFVYTQKDKIWFRKYTSLILLKSPILGSIIQKIYLARFCHSMSLLLSAKTPLVTAIDLVKKMIGFYPLEEACKSAGSDIVKGISFSNSLNKYPIFTGRMLSLIRVAEETNNLEQIFTKLSTQLNEELKYSTGILNTVLKPFLLIFIGIVVGLVLISMYMPLFQLGSSMQY